MAYQRKPGEFSLNKNDKGDNANRPDYRGEGLDLQGNPIEFSVWVKSGPKGEWLSGVIKPKQARTRPETKPEAKPAAKRPLSEDDIPF